MSSLRLLLKGRLYNIYAPTTATGRCRVKEEFEEYEKINPNGMHKVASLLEDIADNGFADHGEQICRQLGSGLYELKERRGALRVFAIHDATRQRVVVVFQIWRKRGAGKEQSQQIERARQWQRNYTRNPPPVEQ